MNDSVLELLSKLLYAAIGCKACGSALSAKRVLDVPQHASEPFPPPALPTDFSLDFATKSVLKPVPMKSWLYGQAILNMRISVVALLMFPVLLAHPAWAEDPVNFPDAALKAAVEDALWVLDPTPSDMLGLTELSCVNQSVTDIKGLEYAENLQRLNLRFNRISSISALSGLRDLRRLDLSRNYEISSISALSGLTQLHYLNLHINDIDRISALSEMTDLTYLDLHGNDIVDISALSKLDKLEHLALNENKVRDIGPLSGLRRLEKLYLHYNQIKDISPLGALTELQVLNIYLNEISDISALAHLTRLHTLSLHYNQVADISALSDLSHLTQLRMQANPLDSEACAIYVPQILANNPGIHLEYDECDDRHTLTLSSSTGGAVTEPGEGAKVYERTETVAVAATATPGYRFENWSGTAVGAGKVDNPHNAHTTVAVDGDYSLTANFSQVQLSCPAVSTYEARQVEARSAVLVASVVSDGGEECVGEFNYWIKGQEEQARNVTPAQDGLQKAELMFERVNNLVPGTTYCYVGRAENSVCLDEGNVREFTTAGYSQVTLTLSSGTGGAIVAPPMGELLFDQGSKVLVKAEANPHSVFVGWSGSAVDAGRLDDPFANPTLVTLDDDYTLQAEFLSQLPVLYVDDDASGDPAPHDGGHSDSLENGTSAHPFDTIQEAINVAADGVRVMVRPGTYYESIDLLGKPIELRGFDPNDPEMLGFPVIDANGAGPVVRFTHLEDPNCSMAGFVMRRGHGDLAGGIYCHGTSPTITNCLIVGNRVTDPNGAALYLVDSNAVFVNCTIADNIGGEQGAGISLINSDIVLANSIVWGNAPRTLLLNADSDPVISYTDIADIPGVGNMDVDPLFAKTGYWSNPHDPNPTVEFPAGDSIWMAGDYHLSSQTGRWDPRLHIWLQDDVTSPCIDMGQPMSPIGHEPAPHGGVVNLGAYGTTMEASKSDCIGGSMLVRTRFSQWKTKQ